MASEFTIVLGDRVYEIEFTPPILKESQTALDRPLAATIRDEKGWRGFTYVELEKLLWVQLRRQNTRLTPPRLNALIEAYLTTGGGTLQDLNLVLLRAFNACGLEYKLATPEAADDADAQEATAAPAARPPVGVADAGTSESPAA